MSIQTAPATSAAIVHVDPNALILEANVRSDVELDAEFVASIRDYGVLVPVLVHQVEEGLRVRAGQRRTLGAIAAGRETIPALIVEGDDGEARRLIEQWSENHHRRALSTGDEADAFQQLALLGLSASQIARRTHAKKERVTAALKVGSSKVARAAAEQYAITLDQAAVIAEFEDDAEVVEALTIAAVDEPETFAHVAQRARDDRAQEVARAALVEDLTAKGLTVVDGRVDLTELYDLAGGDGRGMSTEEHETCPARAAFVTTNWKGELAVVYGCTSPDENGHTRRWGSAPLTEEEEEAAKEEKRAERRHVIETNAAWRSAETVRREWLTAFAKRKSAPANATAFVVSALTNAATVGTLDDSTRERGNALARSFLGITEVEGRYASGAAFKGVVEKVSGQRAQMIALVVILAAIEESTSVQTWRSPSLCVAAYFTALRSWGYHLSEVEAQMIPADDGV
ncbi:ParB N-terminal domain-containing protein [Cellulomonas sp. HD19AZ1]|uniref:ParB/RepB/Spo0J family partition protein n=1 Tax=Cellulomonas sp. HD19AZ1 TaxID=2559593 RepID=UPI001070C515|nr:ParB N-terminal domain-containing protein [Cellulomonas sp. HD19AZ1]TFH68142.1 hypothetical protein E4A51_18020 [Cellulomonas sp. HD19AZ1]